MSTIPSISLIPSGYKANKVYSVLPTDGAADLTFARTSTANRVNSNNLIEEVATGVPRLDYTGGGCPSLLLEPQSTNLITYPLSFNNPYWTKSGASIQGDSSTAGVDILNPLDFTDGWVQNRGTVTNITTASFDADGDASITKSVLEIGKLYIIELVSDVDVIMYSGTTENTGQFIGQGNGTYTFNAETTNISLRTLTNGTATFTTLSVKEVQGFSAPSVDNTTSAFKLVEDTSNSQHWFYKDISLSANTSYTISIFAKYSGRKNMAINIYNGSSSDYAYYDIQNGTILNTPTDAKATITPISNGWYRLTYTREALTTGANYRIALADNAPSVSYTGDGTSGVYIFGAQLEQQPFATSLMLPNTEGSTVTRVAETASKTGLSSYINSVEGVLYWEGIKAYTSESNEVILIGDSNSNRVQMGMTEANQNSLLCVISDGNQSISLNTINFNPLINQKIAVKWSTTSVSLFLNGVKEAENTTNFVTSMSLDELNFSRFDGSNFKFTGNTKDLRVYKTALSDAELVTLTTI